MPCYIIDRPRGFWVLRLRGGGALRGSHCAQDDRIKVAGDERYNSLMSFLRYLMLLSLIVWLGGLIFFAFVLAATAFSILPSRHMAGTLVGRSLGILHWMGIFSGLIFLTSSILYSRFTKGTA